MDDTRPPLKINLSGEEGNVFVVIGAARAMLTGQLLEHFNTDIGRATLVEVGTTYTDVLAIVHRYVELVDTSGLYPEYSKPRDEHAIIIAVIHLNEQLQKLPDGFYCSLEGLYPTFDDPDTGPEIYLSFVTREIVMVEEKMARYKDISPPEPLQRLLAMLEECATALRNAGV